MADIDTADDTFTPGQREPGDSPNLEWHTHYGRVEPDEDGVYWITHPSCACGDYGGSGSVGAANVRYLQCQHGDDVWVECGRSGHTQAYLRDTREHRELLAQLDDYPLFDEEAHSEVEMEWECEAWESWLRSDLVRTLPALVQEWTDRLPDGPDDADVLWECYRAAMEEENEYPIAEYNGVCVRIDRIKDAFGALVTAAALADEVWCQGMLALLAPACPIVLDGSPAALFIALDWLEECGTSPEPDSDGALWLDMAREYRAASQEAQE